MSAKETIYLDDNAAAPVRACAMAAAAEAMRLGVNPSSVHAPGRRARSLIEAARESVAALVNAAPEDIVFTSGGTEANAAAILGVAGAGLASRLIVSATEHDSVLESARLASKRFDIPLDIVRVKIDGTVDLEDLERLLSRHCQRGADKALVSIHAANNETGVVQPLGEIVALAHRYGVLLHTDAVQIAGRLPFGAEAFDLVSLSAHKIGGLAGAGALILREETALAPLWGGGRQEKGRRPGTEPLAAIAAFGAAAEEAARELSLAATHAAWRDAMEARLRAAVPGIEIFGHSAPRLPQTSSIGLPGTLAETQVIALDLAGFALSAGAACSSGKVRASHVLTAMGASEEEARCAIRVSFGWQTREEELHQFTDVWAWQLRRSRDVILRQAQDDALRPPVMVSPSNHAGAKRAEVA